MEKRCSSRGFTGRDLNGLMMTYRDNAQEVLKPQAKEGRGSAQCGVVWQDNVCFRSSHSSLCSTYGSSNSFITNSSLSYNKAQEELLRVFSKAFMR